MADETKPEGQEEQTPAGAESSTPPPANQGPSVEELRKQNEELQQQIKERDARLQDAETTRATIEARQRQIEAAREKSTTDEDMKKRIAQINERRAYDPEGADAEMASLLSEVQTRASESAVVKAQTVIAQQTAVEKLRMGVQSSNPEFDDDVVDVIMQRADQLARTGKYKTAEEAVKAAQDFVKDKFEGYAKKKNAVPPLPAGARGEGGGANRPPEPSEPPKEKTPADEIQEAVESKSRKII